MPPEPVRPREVPAKAPAPRRAPTPWRSSTPMEPPMVTPRERTELYTSMGEQENRTLHEGFRSMSILDPNEAHDTSSLNIRADGFHRPNSRSYTDMLKRTNSRLTIPEKPEEPRQFNAAFEQVLDRLKNNAYQARMRAALGHPLDHLQGPR